MILGNDNIISILVASKGGITVHFKISQAELIKGINIVKKAAPNKHTIELIHGILIVARKKYIRLLATDSEMWIEIKLNAEIINEGLVVINFKIFEGIIKKLDNEDIEISVDSKQIVKIECENLISNIQGLLGNNFLIIPEMTNRIILRVHKNTLYQILDKTIIAVPKEFSRSPINGAQLDVQEGTIAIGSYDGYRISFSQYSYHNNSNKNTKVKISYHGLSEIKEILSAHNEQEVLITISEKYMLLKIENIKIVVKLIYESFTDFNTLISAPYKIRARLNRKDFLQGLQLASVIAGISNDYVKLSLKDKKITISANAEIADIIKIINADLEGEASEVAFNVNFLMDGLKVITEEIIDLYINNYSGIIKPLNNDKYTYFVSRRNVK